MADDLAKIIEEGREAFTRWRLNQDASPAYFLGWCRLHFDALLSAAARAEGIEDAEVAELAKWLRDGIPKWVDLRSTERGRTADLLERLSTRLAAAQRTLAQADAVGADLFQQMADQGCKVEIKRIAVTLPRLIERHASCQRSEEPKA